MIRILLTPIRALLSLDRWREIFDTLSRNALRASLTAVSVGWGVFMLVVLLGLGNGLENGTKMSFGGEAANVISIRGSKTSKAHAGFDVGRTIQFNNGDYEKARAVKQVDGISGRFYVKGGPFGGNEMPTKRGAKSNAFAMNAVHPDAVELNKCDITQGRFLNELDMAQRRKSVVVGKAVAAFLFLTTEDPVGQWININGVSFQIVGVFKNENDAEDERVMYVPVPTAQIAFNGQDRLNSIMFTVDGGTEANATAAINAIKEQLAERHNFSLDDKQAVRVNNNIENSSRFTAMFFMISVFITVIGVLTIGAGIIGVSNIMMITVKERTKEIGIRKALGATPVSIVSLIVQESMVLTAIAGIAGLAAGIGALAAFSAFAPPNDFVRNPSVEPYVGLLATGVLVFFGAIAGFFPAMAAAQVNPIQSLRDQ
jgi:putative ABC transport system permease protein